MKQLYTPYSVFLARYFDGKVQKLPLDAGAGCPVRDGTLGNGGCAFCNGRSFVPGHCSSSFHVAEQLAEGKRFFLRKLPKNVRVSYLAYFQAGSNTYAPVREMRPLIEEALGVEDVCGVVLATRPDCLPPEWLGYLAELARQTFVMVELGVESVIDETLQRVGRGHDAEASRRAVCELAERGIAVGVHLILGLPGERRADWLRQTEWLSALPVDVLKLHQLQVLRGSRMEHQYALRPGDFSLFGLDDYVVLVADYLERLHPRIAVERFVSQSPTHALIAPRWDVKNGEVVRRITDELQSRGSFQGKHCLL